MYILISVVCFSLAAYAAPNGGYNYPQPRPAANQVLRPSQPFSNNPAPALSPPALPQLTAPTSQYIPPIQQPTTSYIPPSSYIPPASGAAVPQYNQPHQRQTILTNTIYIHSAPEETEEVNTGPAPTNPEPNRKNYRILFIKAPSHNIRINVNSIKQAVAENEEKTVIYVLSKKPDITTINHQVAPVQTELKSHKPEVYFIKYKTQAEANRAQQEIQAQYDALGGSTSISDEGFAPVTSVIGSGGSAVGSASFNNPSFSSGSNFAQSASNNRHIGATSPNSGYLPSKNK